MGASSPTLIRIAAGDIKSRDEIVVSNRIFEVAKEHFESPKDGLAELRRIYTEDDNVSSAEFMYISTWAAFFGDQEFAMKSFERGVKIESSGLFFIWSPVMEKVRQLPRFKAYVKKIGLVDYWKEFGWPDLCHPVGDDDFVCD
jgi:hypothetical protein